MGSLRLSTVHALGTRSSSFRGGSITQREKARAYICPCLSLSLPSLPIGNGPATALPSGFDFDETLSADTVSPHRCNTACPFNIALPARLACDKDTEPFELHENGTFDLSRYSVDDGVDSVHDVSDGVVCRMRRSQRRIAITVQMLSMNANGHAFASTP